MKRSHATARLLAALAAEVAALLFMWPLASASSTSVDGPFATAARLDPLSAASKVAAWVSVAILAYLVLVTVLQLLAITAVTLAPTRSLGRHIASVSARLGPRSFAGLAAAVTLAGVTACGPAATSPGAALSRTATVGAGAPVVMVLEAPRGDSAAAADTTAERTVDTVTMRLESSPIDHTPSAPATAPPTTAPSDSAAPQSVAPAPPIPALPDSAPATTESMSAPPAAPGEVTATRGDSLWSIAEDELGRRLGRAPTRAETQPYWGAVVEMNRARLVDPSNPGLIYSGQHFVLP